MRALIACLLISACAQPVPEATPEQIEANLDAPAKGPADNIAAIGAEGLCESAAAAVTERQEAGAVTYCAP